TVLRHPRPTLFPYTTLFRSQVRFVQTAEEMKKELMSRGLAGTRLVVNGGDANGRPAAALEGDRLAQLVQVLGELEEPLVILERRSEEHTSELQSLRHLVCRL